MKIQLIAVLLITSGLLCAQKKQNQTQSQANVTTSEVTFDKSEVRKMIEDASITRINKDWSSMAEFKSGIGEVVQFYPVQVINLKTEYKTNALQLDMYVKKGGTGAAIANVMSLNIGAGNDEYMSAWVGLDEINEFIAFIEQSIVPNLDLKFKRKSSEFIFNAKEITFKYMVDEKRRRLSIILNKLSDSGHPYYFWTEARVDKIPELLPVLKKIRDKEIDFED